jgi:NitT/TauT family transport system substrate-binding protein
LPPTEAELIGELIRRDAPYYTGAMTAESVAAMQRFAHELGILASEAPYQSVIATQFADLWASI